MSAVPRVGLGVFKSAKHFKRRQSTFYRMATLIDRLPSLPTNEKSRRSREKGTAAKTATMSKPLDLPESKKIFGRYQAGGGPGSEGEDPGWGLSCWAGSF